MKREPYKLDDVQSGAQVFWKSLEEKEAPETHTKLKEAEFPFGFQGEGKITTGDPGIDNANVSRRGFLKFGTAATAIFGLEGCIRRPVEKILPYTRAPEQVIPGISTHYASVIERRGEALGVLVESHEGRPTKIEGNPEHPSSKGAADLLAQAAIWNLYDPDRSTSCFGPGGKKASFEEFAAALGDKLKAHEGDGGLKLRFLVQPTNSPSFLRLRDAVRTRFAHARFHVYTPVSDRNGRDGARLAFGQAVHAVHDFARARVILSLDSDFLQTEAGSVRAMRSFTDGRRLRSAADTMNRLYVVEAALTVTGANADHRLRIKAGDVERYARLLATEIAGQGVDLGPVKGALGNHPAEGIPPQWIKAVAKDLVANRGRAVVVVGSGQPASVHALGHALNAALGAIGQVVTYTPAVDAMEPDHVGDLQGLVADLDAKKVDTLVILGGNPVYDAPGNVKFAEKLAGVPTSIHLSSHVDETSAKCTWHVPRAHELEAWGDQRSMDGTLSIQQPLIAPLHGGKSDLELLALASGAAGVPNGYDLVRDTLRGMSGAAAAAPLAPAGAAPAAAAAPATAAPAGGFDKQWKAALKRGLLTGSAPFAFTPREVKGTDIAAELGKPGGKSEGTEVVFLTCPKMLDGRNANNPWLLELPDPMTKVVWDNTAHISPKTAAAMQIASGDLIELSKNGATVTVPAWIQPGQADGSIAVYLGWGRKAAGRYGNDKGFDVNPLRTLDRMYFTDGVAVRKTGGTYPITQTQDHHSMEGRPVAIDATLDEYKATPNFAQFRSPTPRTLPLWNKQDYSKGHKWGMAIDLSTCTGCNACVLACQSENNIPVVGKDQVGRGREMHWLRIDRYFLGNDIADPQLAVMPVACVQCEEAPCENVCPVNATAHSPEGLNDMAYNRCIGTRYCANNCPYKVRRFNYKEFQGGPPGGSVDTIYGDLPETTKMQHNPNVTVRMRGVMEKCTYCVQRIQEAKIDGKRTGKPLKDGAVNTACAQTCPAGAIVFGDLNDPTSRVADLHQRDRHYKLLAELGTHPRTHYLGKIRNPNKEMG